MNTCIHWFPASSPPDDDITVLIADAEDDVTLGFHDSELGDYRYAATAEPVPVPILWWAELPEIQPEPPKRPGSSIGMRVVFGVPAPKPLHGFPPGRIRLRLRHEEFAIARIKNAHGIREFYLLDKGHQWTPGPERAHNLSLHPASP